MAVYRDEVAILQSGDLGEADRLLTLFGKRRGRFRAVAKGVRKLTSRKKGHLQTFNVCRIACAEGRSLDIVVEAESIFVVDATELTAEEYERIGFVGFVLNKFLPDDVQEPGVYSRWKQYIEGNHSDRETADMVMFVLEELGFMSDERREKLIRRDSKDIYRLRTYVAKIIDNA